MTQEYEASVYDLATQDLGRQVTDLDRLISKAIYENKQYLGPRGMVEYALVIARTISIGEGRIKGQR
jgi:hypothetical protein